MATFYLDLPSHLLEGTDLKEGDVLRYVGARGVVLVCEVEEVTRSADSVRARAAILSESRAGEATLEVKLGDGALLPKAELVGPDA